MTVSHTGGKQHVILDQVGVALVSGQVPTTAAGGGSNVNVTNVSGNVRTVIQGVDVVGSALNVNATFNASQISVTAGQSPLPVNMVQTSAQVHVTAGDSSLPVTIQGIESAGSALRVIAIQGSETKVTGTGTPLPALASISGDVRVTAGNVDLPVKIANVSGQIPVTAGGSPLPVLASISGQVNVTATNNIGISAAALPQQDVSAHAFITNQPLVGICGVNVASSAIQVDLKGVGVASSALNVNATFGAAEVAVTAGGSPLPVSAAGVKVSGARLEIDISRVGIVSGAIKTTAVGAGGAAVAITNVSGDVRVTAPNNIGISAASLPNVSAAIMGWVETSGTPAQVNERTVGMVGMTSSRALYVDVKSPGTNIGVSAAALPQQDVSAHAFITNQPLVGVCGVNTVGSALNVNIVNVSGQVAVTAGGSPLPVLASISGQVGVTAGNSPLPVLASISGDVRVTAGNTPITVSANNPLGLLEAQRGDAIFNALVSNPVKFARFPQTAGAVCADIVAAVASRKIRVIGGAFFATSTCTMVFMTTGASAALTPQIVVANGYVLPPNPYGWFETATGSALDIQIENGRVGGFITYQEVF